MQLKIEVKSIKYYLKRAIGNLKLESQEFLMVLIQVKDILNSRPHADIDYLNFLSSIHFLIGWPITAIIDSYLKNIGDNRLNHC